MGCGASAELPPPPAAPVALREPVAPPAPPELSLGTRIARAQARPQTPKQVVSAPVVPSAQECRRWGISLEGLEHFAAKYEMAFGAAGWGTTSDAVHSLIKPATVPDGWTDEVAQVRRVGKRRWYRHIYRESEPGGRVQETPPRGTRSYCELMRADPATAGFVGAPTVFFSHAWRFNFHDVLEAIRNFVEARPAGSPPTFFWFDAFSLDEHATSLLSEQWWSDMMQGTIAAIGHTLLHFKPWGSPRGIGELLATLTCGARLSLCFGHADKAAFEVAVLGNLRGVLTAWAKGADVQRATEAVQVEELREEQDRARLVGRIGSPSASSSAIARLQSPVKKRPPQNDKLLTPTRTEEGLPRIDGLSEQKREQEPEPEPEPEPELDGSSKSSSSSSS